MDREKVLNKLSRRHFIRNSVIAASGAVLLPSALTSCKKDKDGNEVFEGQGFNEGVASFDPSQDRVILWTRYTPAAQETGKPTIILDVARDKDFKNVVASQSVEVDSNSDNTVHVDVSKLTSNTKYYYRFRSEKTQAVSVTGETKTLPAAGEAAQVKMAVVSCANFQAGLFNVYGAVAESDADFVVHLGDYIYEYQAGGYGTNADTATLKREHKPAGEIIKLDDYRQRYRQYRSDEQLQKAHQLKPFICVWDDHEVANDAYKDGAENHQPNEGDYTTRKLSAIQVWHEYLPARVQDNAKIYRNFEIAGLVNLVMLDTRIIGRDKQLSYNDYLTPSGLNTTKFLADWQNPQRTILGTEQRNWLSTQLGSSTAKWQVLGNQVLMGKMFMPAELLLLVAQIAGGNADPQLLTQYNTLVTQLVTIKARLLQNDPTLTPTEKARVQTVLPYNLDAWDGYPAEREMVYAAANGKKLISLAGDTHNAWYADLSTSNGQKAGVEFATASVTSPGFEAIFGSNPQTVAGFEQANALLIDDLQYMDATRRGYIMATFSASEAKSEWRYVNTIASKNTATVTSKTVTVS
ncbi:alkaline phosphatase D family protein [Mucilaginibacter sp. Bleaf8]|uniref:alkaline phosphatase D family protein n=1 Tax=Mucilaginibacter sp. Bleaf8 TaxID=2834430 RepID=UPI001BD11866|nr:alkaline phosphatase D family protein [Mucilaginibacter sp. Bleaf8]MBS7565791.1 alkaline phosphatase D family protein [Mucilaginibacter sp. Bleaf8]